MRFLGSFLAKDLRFRFLLAAVPASLGLGAIVLFAFWVMAQELIQDLGSRVAVNQVLLDRARAALPLSRDFVLAETLASNGALVSWFKAPDDSAARADAADVLEHFRGSFADESYFAAPRASLGFYYHDGVEGSANLSKPEYILDSENPEDAWFFSTMALPGVCHVNIDFDRELRKTKVWFNCNVRDPTSDQVLGIVGSGIELTGFIDELQRNQPDGVTAIYVDSRGAIQAHPDVSLIVHDALTKEGDLENTIFDILDADADRAALADALVTAELDPDSAVPTLVSIEGRSHLIGVSFIPTMNWFSVSVMDLRTIVFGDYFIPLAGLTFLAIVLSLGVLTVTVNRVVLRRVYDLDAQVEAFKSDNRMHVPKLDSGSPDQLDRLRMDFAEMAEVVQQHTTDLEDLVAERTRELEALASLDPMTGVRNRRSFFETAAREEKRMSRAGGGNAAVMILDLDHFKKVNDTHGHAVGDEVIQALSNICSETLRDVDVFGRLGGEEFGAVLVDTDINRAVVAAERIRRTLGERSFGDGFSCTVSIGIAGWTPAESDLETVMEHADAALYEAKNTGRDRVVVSRLG